MLQNPTTVQNLQMASYANIGVVGRRSFVVGISVVVVRMAGMDEGVVAQKGEMDEGAVDDC